MTDQFQWQGALAAAEFAIRAKQIEEAESSLRIALTLIGTFERNDPARLPILAAFIRCCEHANVLAESNFHAQWTLPTAQVADDRAIIQERSRILQLLRNIRLSAYRLRLNSQLSQLGEDDAAVVATLLKMAHLEWDRNEFKSFPLLHQALAICERTLGVEHLETLAIVRRLASDYDTLVSYKEAIPLWQRLLAYIERVEPLPIYGSCYSASGVLFNLGKAYNYLRFHREAKNTWERYLALTEHRIQQAVEPSDIFEPHQIDAYYGVGYACLALQEWHEAASSLAHAVDKHRTTPFHDVIEGNGASLIDLATGITAYAEALARIGDHDRAIQLCEEAIVLYRRRDRRYADLLSTYATALRASGNEQKATAIKHEASALKEDIEAKMRRQRFRRSAQP